VSAEVPKLYRRLPLEDKGAFKGRPPVEVVVLLTDPVASLPTPSSSPVDDKPSFDDRTIAFPAVHRFEFV